jgi:hypothetical protein
LNFVDYKNQNEKRDHIRIFLHERVHDDIGLEDNCGNLVVNNSIIMPCTIENVSYSGAYVGVTDSIGLQGNDSLSLTLVSNSRKALLRLPGLIVRIDRGNGKRLHGVGIKFNDSTLPLEYKDIISTYWENFIR